MITQIEDCFSKGCGRCARFDTPECSTTHWAGGLAGLRALCLGQGLGEEVKWGHPCYTHAGRNIALIGAFRDDFRLTFFNAALLGDPQSVLERRGPNTRTPDMIRFTSEEQVARMAPAIEALLREAMGFAEQGAKPPRDDSAPEMPDELTEALDCDPELAEAFHALTPGRRRSYLINLNGAKQAETRRRRIAGFRGRILAGKGATER